MRNQKKYDREFKLNVIKHHRESGKSMTSISRDFEVPMGTLAGWIQEFQEQGEKKQGEKSLPGSGKIKPCNEEMYRLRKELTDMKQERDILKKGYGHLLTTKKRKLEFMKKQRYKCTVKKMAKFLEVSRSNFYHFVHRKPSKRAIENAEYLKKSPFNRQVRQID